MALARAISSRPTRGSGLRSPAVAAALTGLLLAGCGDGGTESDGDAVAADTDDAAVDDDSDGQETEPTDTGADETEDENPLLEFQSDIEIPDEVNDAIELPESFQPDSLFADIENESDGTLESRVSGEVEGDPEDLVEAVGAAVEAGDWDSVETEEITADGNPRTRHKWRAEGDDVTLEVDLVTEEGVDGGSLTIAVIRPA